MQASKESLGPRRPRSSPLRLSRGRRTLSSGKIRNHCGLEVIEQREKRNTPWVHLDQIDSDSPDELPVCSNPEGCSPEPL